MFKFGFKFKHLIYGSFFFLLACNDAAREASEIRVFSIDISVTGLEEGESVQITETKSGVSRTIATNSRSSLPDFNLGDPFSIEVTVNPVNKRCTVSNSNTTGLIDGASDNVNITCLGLFSISGNITGLESDSLVLRLNAEEELSIDKADNFIFSTPLVDGSAYAVIVVTQPSTPSQICSITYGSGSVSGANVTDVSVSCVNGIPPTASNVSIIDKNGGNALVSDSLTGNYIYNDVNDNVEGTSTFRWLRNGVAISGATLSTYTLVAADVPTQITFEVTPVAATSEASGSATASATLATGTAPVVSGFARYVDINRNSTNDAKDQLIIPFDQDVITNAVSSTDFNLPVAGDTLGTGTTVAAGPGSNEVTITLGTSPNFKTRQDFSSAITVANSASGIDVAASMTAGAIQGASGIDAAPSVPIDLISTFVDSGQSLGANDSTSVSLGDLDGDGDLDMVVANIFDRSGEANRIYTNDGVGNFTDSGQLLGTNNGNSVALGDLDSDGDLDMVVANSLEANRVYRNDGAGNFTDSNQLLGANNITFSISLGDVDGDGDLDMAVANGDANQVYTNNDGAGSFIDSGQVLDSHLNFSLSVALGDVDADGDLDMVVANLNDLFYPNDEANQVYKNNDGLGSFIDSSQALGTNYSQSIALGDMDGDGDLDMVVANRNSNRVYINDGAGNFIDSGQLLGASISTSIALGDVDGDGDLDIVIANDLGEANRVYLNSLAGTE